MSYFENNKNALMTNIKIYILIMVQDIAVNDMLYMRDSPCQRKDNKKRPPVTVETFFILALFTFETG